MATRIRVQRRSRRSFVSHAEMLEGRCLLSAGAYTDVELASGGDASPGAGTVMPLEQLAGNSTVALTATNSSSNAYSVGTVPSTLFAAAGGVNFRVTPPAGTVGPVEVSMASRGYEAPVISAGPAGVQTYTYALPVVGTAVSFTFDPSTGSFGYAPDADDRFEFDLTFRVPGQDGLGLPIAQRVTVVPRDLPAEGDLVSSATQNLPNPESLDYLTVNVTNGTTRQFNSIPGVPTRNVEITGKTLVWAPGHASGLYERFAKDADRNAHSKDIENLTMYAERVVIGAQVRLPQTNVTIYARELVFQDQGTTASRIDTTPLSFVGSVARANQFENGKPGENAGNITLHVGALSAPGASATHQFVMNGGAGQAAGEGAPGQRGVSLVSHGTFDGHHFVAQYRTSEWRYRGFPGYWYIQTYTPYKSDVLRPTTTTGQVLSDDMNGMPTDGKPAAPGGRPGTGGRGGTLSLPEALRTSTSPLVSTAGGAAGARASNRPGGAAGTPRDARHYHFYASGTASNRVDTLDRSYRRKLTVNGTAWTAPAGTTGATGSVQALTPVADGEVWLRAAVLRPMVNYVKDAYLAGNIDFAREALLEVRELLEDAPPPAAGQADPYQPLRAEVEVLRGRAEAGLDYFGNPAGWTPMLSLVSTLAAYQGEIDSAIRVKYLARLVERAAANNQAAADALNATLGQLDAEILRYQVQLDAHQQLLPRLQQQIGEIETRSQEFQFKLRSKEQELAARAERNVRGPFWKRALGVLGSVLKVFPLGQPALGKVGTGLQTVANLSSQPLEAIQQVAGLGGTLKEVLPGLKSARDELARVGVNIKAPSKATKAELESYVSRVSAEGKRWGEAINKLNDEIQPYTAPKDKVEAELAKLKAEDPEFNALVDELTEFNATKEVFARDLANSLKTIGDSVTEMAADQQAALAINRRLTEAAGRLDRDTVAFVRDLARRSDERLLRWQYFMAKAYEYETLTPYGGNFNLDALAQRIANVVEGGGGVGWLDAPSGNVGSTPSLGIDDLRTIYEIELRAISNKLVDDLATTTNSRRFKSINRPFRLTAAEIQQLNEDGEVTINLVDRGLINVNGAQDAVRLTNVRAEQVEATAANPSSLPELAIEFFHNGVGRQRAGGQVFQFRHHRTGSIDTLVNENPIRLGATRFYVGSGDPAIQDTADRAQLALLSYLLDGQVPAVEEVQFVQPAAWADITIRKSGAGVTLDDALFRFDYSYTAAPSDLSTLDVRPLDPTLAPAVTIHSGNSRPVLSSAVDGEEASGRTDGRGAFSRTYDKFSVIQLVAEPFYGGLDFARWVDDAGRTLGTSPAVTVSLDRHRVVRPVYVTPPTPAWLAAPGAATWDAATKTLTVTGAATIVADPGADAPLILASSPAASLTIAPAAGARVNVGGITLANGAVVTFADAAADRVLVVGTGGLSVTGSAKLDLADNALVVRGGTLAAVRSLVGAGFRGGDWLGTGITSSTAAQDASRATSLGYATFGAIGRSEFAGVAGLSADDVLVRHTYYGDTNLDRMVNTDDILNILADGKLDTAAPATWFEGDMTFDDLANTDDILQILAAGQLDKEAQLQPLL